jgi:hypothetical protein
VSQDKDLERVFPLRMTAEELERRMLVMVEYLLEEIPNQMEMFASTHSKFRPYPAVMVNTMICQCTKVPEVDQASA